MEPREILARPYARVLVPEPNGHYAAEIMEFPNCVASGDTPVEALANLDDVAADWIAAALEQGQNIPEPMETADYSGRLVLRMPKGLHRRAALLAEREGASLNQFIVTCLAEAVGERAKPHGIANVNFHQAIANVSFKQNLVTQLVFDTGQGFQSSLAQGSESIFTYSCPYITPIPAMQTVEWLRTSEPEHA